MHNHGRKGGWIVGLTLGLCLLAPGSALAEHDLKIYKAEKQVDLTADDKAIDVSCLNGDHVLDGMWRIDHADFDDYKADLDNIRTAADVLEARATSDDTYSFRFVKNAIGRVQLKIFVTCLGGTTVGGAHDHSFATSFVKSNGTTQAVTEPNFEHASSGTITGTGSATTPVVTTVDTTGANCPTNTILVSPGFNFGPITDPGPPVDLAADSPEGNNRLYHSKGTNLRNWTWKFDNSALPSAWTTTVTTSWRCLKIKVPTAPSGEKHKLVAKYRTSVFNPSGSGTSEGRLDCGDHYKAIVGGFGIDDPVGGLYGANNEFDNVYYLGMDPRIKQRAYKFLNKHASGSFTVDLAVACINYRTT
jgi:hypothetical protein